MKNKGNFTDYFAPKKNVYYARYLFLKMRPLAGEVLYLTPRNFERKR